MRLALIVALSAAAALAVSACGLSSPSSEHLASTPADAGCPVGTKLCGASCVGLDDPATGCGNATCTPCASEAGAATCVHHQCAAPTPDPVAEWLRAQSGGWCMQRYNQFLSLCNDLNKCVTVPDTNDDCFCFDATLLRPYPDGLAFDIGFYWDGKGSGAILDAGGDCDWQRVLIAVEDGGRLFAGGPSNHRALVGTLTPGRHIVSIYMTAANHSLFVDGHMVDISAGPGTPPAMITKCGPGVVLGQRISYQWEDSATVAWLRFAPFLVHMREGVDPTKWSLDEVTKPQPRSVIFMDKSGVDGTVWRSQTGGRVGTFFDRPTWHEPAEGCF